MYNWLTNRVHQDDPQRSGDVRSPYERDKARIVHCAGFRRLQGKTQVMGIGEGDFHRTRLTHTIEVAQIGSGLINMLKAMREPPPGLADALPPVPLVEAACLSHDIGHPPFGQAGERALQKRMLRFGGFEGNAQTLRILTRLEKYNLRYQGLNPTARLTMAVLKYGVPYSRFPEGAGKEKPPKCYYDSEDNIIRNCVSQFPASDASKFLSMNVKARGSSWKPDPQYMTLDASIMELADDIAYAVHDLEDVVARGFVGRKELEDELLTRHPEFKSEIPDPSVAKWLDALFSEWSGQRKQVIARMVNSFVTRVQIREIDEFEHPLLRFNVSLPKSAENFLKTLKGFTYDLVVSRANIQQLESRGERIVRSLFREISRDPQKLIPTAAWKDLDPNDTIERRAADYISGMTDAYAEKIFHRLFTPGYGSSRDEL